LYKLGDEQKTSPPVEDEEVAMIDAMFYLTGE